MYLTINNVIGLLAQTRSLQTGRALGEMLAVLLDKEQDRAGAYSLAHITAALEACKIDLSAGEYTALSGIAQHRAGK